MKKLISVVLVIIMLCSMLVGCGNSEIEKLEDTNELTLYITPLWLSSVEESIKIFRNKYPDVDIKMVDISSLSEDEYNTKLRTETLAGKGPDVIIYPPNVDNLYKSAQSGIFCDLDELIKQDEEFQLSDYNEKAMGAGVFNGTRYLLPLNYSIPHLLTTQSILDETQIDINNSMDYLELSREFNKYLNKGNIKSHVFSDEMDTLTLFRCNGDVLVDYDKSTINLDSTELKESLSLYKNFLKLEVGDNPTPQNKYYTPDTYLDLKEKAKVFLLYWSSPISMFRAASALKSAGEEPVIIPIRGFDGKIQSAAYVSAGIRRNSNNKKNAFNFIKIMLSDTTQQKYSSTFGLPVSNDTFDKFINDLANRDDSKLPKHFYDQYIEDLNEIESCRFLDEYSYSYILKYMEPFFNDEKSYEECLKAAKSAFEIYVSE